MALRRHGRTKTPTDLLEHSCLRVWLPNNAIYRWRFEKAGETMQVDVNGAITLDESNLARIAVLDDVGIGFFMEADVRDDIAAGRLERVLVDWMPEIAPLGLYHEGCKNPSAAFCAFVKAVRQFGARSGC